MQTVTLHLKRIQENINIEYLLTKEVDVYLLLLLINAGKKASNSNEMCVCKNWTIYVSQVPFQRIYFIEYTYCMKMNPKYTLIHISVCKNGIVPIISVKVKIFFIIFSSVWSSLFHTSNKISKYATRNEPRTYSVRSFLFIIPFLSFVWIHYCGLLLDFKFI